MKKTNQRLLSFLLLLIAAATLLAFGVFTNVLTDLWGTDIKASFRNNPWLIAAFALLLGVVGYLYTKIESRSEKSVIEEVDKDQYDEAFVQFRKNLFEQYQTRLNSKTGRRLPVNLSAKSTDYGFDPERAKVFLKNQTIESENIASEIDKILKTNDRLLLIGDPGAGKTTILLYAAINILRDESEPKLPLILNLATWTKERDFAEWYAQNIAHSYSLSPVFVQELLKRNAVVPFFDGFDEVAEEYCDDCFRKMAAYFGDEKRKQLIVSSRKKEYAAAETDAPVYAEIEVLPLSLTQIKKALSENAESQTADRALLHALEHDRWLAEAVETPFYLNTASFLFGKGQRTIEDFRSEFKADSTEERQTELMEIFVAGQAPDEQDRKYLSFLAKKMNEENFLVFELVKMQPWWCKDETFYPLPIILIFWMNFGFLEIMGFRLSIFLYGSSSSIYPILEILGTLGLSILLVGLFIDDEIKTKDVQVWRWKTVVENWDWDVIDKDKIVFAYSIAMILVFASIMILVGSAIAGLIGGGIFASIYILKNVGSKTNFLLYINNPYKRFWSTFRESLWTLFFLLVAIFSAQLSIQLFSIKEDAMSDKFLLFFIPVTVGLLILYFLIISQFFQHFSLRLVLYLEGKMPLRVVTFMDRMTDQLIFEDNRRTDKKGKKMRGATWRFRHKILQDYFAEKPA